MDKAEPAKIALFCEHGMGVGNDMTCPDCGSERKGVHDVPWNEQQQAFVWPLEA